MFLIFLTIFHDSSFKNKKNVDQAEGHSFLDNHLCAHKNKQKQKKNDSKNGGILLG